MFSWTKVFNRHARSTPTFASCLGFIAVIAVVVLALPRAAFAQKPVLIHVIALDSDDASEDQADALTAALRQRVRSTPTWQVAESNQSLSTLLPALRCPSRPDSACLQRIGDQLKTDRFFWGTVTKASVAHQVVAEVHLWTRGKPEQVAKETYSDNLKDQNDDALKRISAQLFERLTGQSTQGTVIVHATGTQTGTVVVDGKPMAQLANGIATVSLGSGAHTVDIEAPGMSTTPQSVSVVVNVQSELTFDLKASAVATPIAPSGPSHIKKTIGFVTLGVAGASAIAAAIFGGLYAGDASKFNDYRSGISTSNTQICSAGVVLPPVGSTDWSSACNARNSASTEGSLAWGFGGAAIGLAIIGVVLVVTDHPSQEGQPPPMALRVLPSFGPNGGGLSALLTF
jgi:hypothetical protein